MKKIWLKKEKKCYKCPINFRKKNKQPITKHVYENNTIIKTKRTLIFGRSGCVKTFLMLSLYKNKNKKLEDVHIICKTDNQYHSKYYNQSSDILPLEDYGKKLIVIDDMLGSKDRRKSKKDIHAFFLVVAIKILIFITSLNHGLNYLKTLSEKIVVGLCCFHKH